MSVIAEELAKKQREVSVAEFFERNRHLLGFDNKRKALLTVVKEAVDNALDACEEARILPDISVEVIDMTNDRFRIIVEDNGPGIVKKNIPNVFAKLLYGSKFHAMKQSRGQQGIGISAAVLYAQLTTGRPAKITSKISKDHPAEYFELHLDTQKNAPEIVKEEQKVWKKEHGVKIELDISATYQKGDQSVDTYLKETAIVNPHATIIYTSPKAEQLVFPRATDKLPIQPHEIKPHPEGVELGRMQKMLKFTESRTLQSFLTNEFSRVGPNTAKEICQNATLLPQMKPSDMQLADMEKLMDGITKTKIMAPPTDCVVPIGADLLEKGLKKEIAAEFYTSVTRSPSVYRGTPFVVEIALAYGGAQPADQSITVLRFANRVPLLYQQSACASFKSVLGINWKPYGLQQSQGALPSGPLTIAVHLASVWPPFTSEAKEAIAHYPEIVKEMKLALQECGRKLGLYVNKKRRAQEEQERVNIFEVYIPEVAASVAELAGEKKEKLLESLQKMLAKNKEFIAKHKGQEVTENKHEKKDAEDQVSLKRFAERDDND
ncbi:DNA topoisomerase VI subunit B [Candidatus Woesearchaeota archaeon]|nr:DNA topoisomerase VI subunit B [Candidatus Woesearchaeota archaeon]